MRSASVTQGTGSVTMPFQFHSSAQYFVFRVIDHADSFEILEWWLPTNNLHRSLVFLSHI